MNAVNRNKMWAVSASSIVLALACAVAAAAGGGAGGPAAGGRGGLGGRGGAPGGARGASAGPQSPPPKALYPDIKPVLTAEQLKEVKIENTTIEMVTPNADGSIRITAIVTHPPARDRVQVFIGLPANWNGRFQGTGGGGWSGGSAPGANLLSQGWAAG